MQHICMITCVSPFKAPLYNCLSLGRLCENRIFALQINFVLISEGSLRTQTDDKTNNNTTGTTH